MAPPGGVCVGVAGVRGSSSFPGCGPGWAGVMGAGGLVGPVLLGPVRFFVVPSPVSVPRLGVLSRFGRFSGMVWWGSGGGIRQLGGLGRGCRGGRGRRGRREGEHRGGCGR